MTATVLPRSPYVGLAPYAAEDAAFFFGRDLEIEVVAANLMSRPLTVLFGGSGVGKSSLLRAGLVRYMHLNQGSDFVVAICSSWRDDPSRAIGDAVRAAFAESEPLPSTDDLLATLEEAVSRCRELFVVLDQFEEYFLYHGADDDQALARLLRSAVRGSLPVSFLIAVRDDALAKLDRLREIPSLLDHRIEVGHLDRDAATQAITRPLEYYNTIAADAVAIEAQLVDAVLEDVATGKVTLDGRIADDFAIETPFLQVVMERLWEEERSAGSDTLRFETLRRLGGAESIVRGHLDNALNVLTPQEQELAAEIFRYLVTPSGATIAYTAHDLAAYVSHSIDDVHRVLDKLAAGEVRIVRITLRADGKVLFEIFHSVLAAAILDWSTRRRIQRHGQEAVRLRRIVRLLSAVAVVLAAAVVVLSIYAFR